MHFLSIEIKEEVNVIKFYTRCFITQVGNLAFSKGGFDIKIPNLLSFHRVLHKWDFMTGNKVVTFILQSTNQTEENKISKTFFRKNNTLLKVRSE